MEINTVGTFNILEAAISGNVQKVILASSAAIYGNSPMLPKKEGMVPVPKSPYAAAIPIFIQKALKNEKIMIYGDGMQTRDFVFVNDVVHANELMISKGDGMTFNVANGIATSIKEIAEQIIKQTGSKSDISYTKERSGDIKHGVADISEISKIGFKPKYNIDEGLNKMVEWFRSSCPQEYFS